MNESASATTPAIEPESSFKSPLRLALAGLALGIVVEVLFFDHVPGVSFGLWAAACVGGAFVMAMAEGISPARTAGILALPVLVFSFLVAIRLEPLSVFLDVVLTFFFLGWMVRAFRQGRLFDYGWIDMVLAVVWTPLEAWIRPWGVLQNAVRRVLGERAARSRAMGILRGVVLVLPLLVIFASLFASADLVFSDYVDRLLRWLNIDLLTEYLARLLMIVFSAVFLLGALVVALRHPGDRPFVGRERPLVTRFLGFTEGAVILGGVDLLFLLFVAVQFGYLFGGQANITAAGYTYSEYARRGFFELVIVAVLSFGMIYALAVITRREAPRESIAFHVGAVSLVVLTGAILVSAMYRLVLYEEAYGFTRLRTYTHVAIIWMAIQSVVFLALLLTGRLRQSASLAAFGVVGFALTVNLMSIDGFIVRRNAARMERGGQLDIPYLLSLSDDAVPELVDLADRVTGIERTDLLPGLACRRATVEDWFVDAGWPSAHAARLRAREALAGMDESLRDFPVREGTGEMEGWGKVVVLPSGEQVPCFNLLYRD
jgi:hypothetical protein